MGLRAMKVRRDLQELSIDGVPLIVLRDRIDGLIAAHGPSALVEADGFKIYRMRTPTEAERAEFKADCVESAEVVDLIRARHSGQ